MLVIEKSFNKDSYHVILEATESSKDLRLDSFLQLYLVTLSREFIKNKIKKGDVKLFGRPGTLRPSTKILKGDRVQLFIQKSIEEDEYWHGEKIKLEADPVIVFEDEDLIVISKPPYMATHPTGRHLFYCATVYFETIHKKTIHSIHRIDRETSGLLLLGKNPSASSKLANEFEEDRVKKAYFFISKILPEFKGQNEFWAKERLGTPEEGLKRVYIHSFPENSSEGKEAQTFFKILHTEGEYAVGLAFPVTGRQHQIRVHALVHGLPLVGDKLYLGGFLMFQRFKDNIASIEDYNFVDLPRHALHAIALKINHKGKAQLFLSPLPNDLSQWIEKHFSFKAEFLQKEISKQVTDYFSDK